jgi:hypothetical protein
MNAITITQNWVKEFIVGMNFCPFAKAPFTQERIRYILEESDDIDEFAKTLFRELAYLKNNPEVETTLIIHPNLLNNFQEYLLFLEVAEQLLEEIGLEGIFQIASFHPDYQFEGTAPDDVENYTNRSPFPMLHILREESVSKAVDTFPNLEDIPQQNIVRLQALGIAAVKQRWNEIRTTH